MSQSIAALGYIDIGVSDIEHWRSYATDVLGVMVADSPDALYLRMDEKTWRIRLSPSGEDDLVCVGFEMAGAAALKALVENLESNGIAVQPGSSEAVAERGVDQLMVCSDPFGLRIEFYTGKRESPHAFSSPLDVAFVTGEQGLGHIVLFVDDEASALGFYQDILGFRLSDHITLGPDGQQLRLTFMHCNARHHTLALVPVQAPATLNHIMLQTQSLDEVGNCSDRAIANGVTISSTLGKHTNDKMVSFYMKTPSGFDIEFGFGAVEIDDATWETGHYDAPSIWGHKGELNPV